jgi:hypothetical protein
VLKFGKHPPVLFVHGQKKKVFFELSAGSDHQERVEVMTRTAIQLAKNDDLGELESVIFVCEGWASPPRTPMVMPSQDPNREEVLIITGFDVRTKTQTAEVYAMVRDYKHAIVDLKPVFLPKEGQAVASDLLPSFVAGYQTV